MTNIKIKNKKGVKNAIINILRIVKLKIKNEKLEKENQRLRSLLNLNENTIL